MPPAALESALPSPPAGREAIEAIARLWIGRFANHRQVEASITRGGPPAPDLTREHRSLEVVRLEAPQLGEMVLYLQECRATVPGRAHRQRVIRLVAPPDGGEVRAEQLFFREGPTYDRPLVLPEAVAGLEEDAFTRWPGCDLHFHFEPARQRWRGAMRPGTCRYPHPLDGEVCADFAMLLSPDEFWYRDRSLRVREGRWSYSQTSLFPQAGDGRTRIEASGWIDGGRLWFQSDRLGGWAMDVPEAPGTTVLLFESKDGSNLRLREISQLVEGGRRRFRTTQTLRDGQLLSRTHIDEHRTSDDWRCWSPPETSAADG